mmetsp:Transcript_11586/g.37039  ORF Transcript_11586/g.37039 Transcript_11586/m.37039 type:complete len:206 (-) Transcript_11586:669-1286(-)
MGQGPPCQRLVRSPTPTPHSFVRRCVRALILPRLNLTAQRTAQRNISTLASSPHRSSSLLALGPAPRGTSLAKVAATSSGNTSVASAYTLTGRAPSRILPQDTASSGRAPASEPSNSWAVLTKTAQSAPLRIRLALHTWCFTRPPPSTIMPLFLARRAMSLMRRMSPAMSTTRPGLRYEWKKIMSPMLPSVMAGQKTGMSFLYAQ